MTPLMSNFYKSQNYRDKIQTSGCLELRGGIGGPDAMEAEW